MMETSRCAKLMVVAAVNKLPEVWVSRCPLLLLLYYSQYFPGFFLRYCITADSETGVFLLKIK